MNSTIRDDVHLEKNKDSTTLRLFRKLNDFRGFRSAQRYLRHQQAVDRLPKNLKGTKLT